MRFGDVSFCLISRSDDSISNKHYYDGFYPLLLLGLNLFSELTKKFDHRCDIGANVGFYRVVASLSNPSARIDALEPSNGNVNRLVENIKNEPNYKRTYSLRGFR